MLAVFLRFPEEPEYEQAKRWILPAVPREGDFLLDRQGVPYKVDSVVWDMKTTQVFIQLMKLEDVKT